MTVFKSSYDILNEASYSYDIIPQWLRDEAQEADVLQGQFRRSVKENNNVWVR